MSFVSRDYHEAHAAAQADAQRFDRPMGLEKANEYGRTVYRVKMLPKDPAKRFGWECWCEVVEPLRTADGRDPFVGKA